MKRPKVLPFPLSRACLSTFAPCYQLLEVPLSALLEVLLSVELEPSDLSLTARLRRGAQACAVARSFFISQLIVGVIAASPSALFLWHGRLKHTEAYTSTVF